MGTSVSVVVGRGFVSPWVREFVAVAVAGCFFCTIGFDIAL